MDFNDYRLFAMPDILPSMSAGLSNNKPNSNNPPMSMSPQLNLTEYDTDQVQDADLVDGWSCVDLDVSGDIDSDLSPAEIPNYGDDRMTRSFDDCLSAIGMLEDNHSFPSGRMSRTLEDTVSPLHMKSSPLSISDPTAHDVTATESDKIKYKLLSVWNNMKFGIKPKTSFKTDSPIWYLGVFYHCTKSEERQHQHESHNNAVELFKKDFVSRIWFTYRKDFPALCGSHFTTDVGWGCMLRSGQMMLAQGLVMHFLGRAWRWYSQQGNYDSIFHHQIIKFFGDFPSGDCPFSLHQLVKIGAESGKKIGDWYGPASVAFVLKDAMERAQAVNAILQQVSIYVAQDGTIYNQDVMDLCTKPGQVRSQSGGQQMSPQRDELEESWRAVIILIPVRLGGDALNPIYIPCIQSMLAQDNCIGIIGGKPRHSLYFVGWQDDKLIYMDPHLCQETVDVRHRYFSLQTFHCMSPRKMHFSKMDPSCTIGFYCKNKSDYNKFVKEAQMMTSPPKEKGLYPMFVFQSGRCSDLMATHDQPETEERYLRVRRLDHKGRLKGKPRESDDFVFL